MNLRKYEINGKFYDLENVAENIKQGRWNEGIDMLASGAGISREQASSIVQEMASAIGIGQNNFNSADPEQQSSYYMSATHARSGNFGASLSSAAEKLSGKRIANIIKILAAISAVLGIIVSLAAGAAIGRTLSYMAMEEPGFSFTAFLISILSTLVVSSMMYGFGEVISLLVDIKNKEK